MRSLLMVCGLIILSGLAVVGNDFEKGLAAYERQEYAKALEILQPPAIAGNAEAQNLLGKVYNFGQGGAKDGKEAAKWFIQAARNGNRESQEIIASVYNSVRMAHVFLLPVFRSTIQFKARQRRLMSWSVSFATKSENHSAFMISHSFSIGLRSGEYGGRRTRSKFSHLREALLCHEALSQMSMFLLR